MELDTSFDFRSDAGGRDPDLASPTLRRYHRRLWSKPLPNGTMFALHDSRPGSYLHHESHLGEFFLSSDTVMPSFGNRRSMRPILDQIPEVERQSFEAARYSIGAMMVFPSNMIDRKMTINGARGLNPKIADRFDLTLECVRRHYLRQPSPLGETLDRYAHFLALFGDFAGYVDFFVLQDLTTSDGDAVSFVMPFDDFTTPAMPADVQSYVGFR